MKYITWLHFVPALEASMVVMLLLIVKAPVTAPAEVESDIAFEYSCRAPALCDASQPGVRVSKAVAGQGPPAGLLPSTREDEYAANYFPLVLGETDYMFLPQNLLINPGVQIEDFEVVRDWMKFGNTGSFAANTLENVTGNQSIKVTSGLGKMVQIGRIVDWDLSEMQRMSVMIYFHDPLEDYTLFRMDLSSSTEFLSYVKWPLEGGFMSGWVRINMLKSEFDVVNGESWSNPMERMKLYAMPVEGKVTHLSYDDLRAGMVGYPAVMIQFDDGRISVWDNAFPLMQNHKIRGTVFMTGAAINTPNNLSGGQLQDLDAAGWTIGNHTYNHIDLTTLSQKEMELELNRCQAELAVLNLTHDSHYVSYPLGGFNDDVYAAMAATGMRTGRGGEHRISMLPPFHLFRLEVIRIDQTTTLEEAKGHIDFAIANGTIAPLVFHSIVENPTSSSEWSIANFSALLDYIASKRRQIAVITADDYYNLTLGPVMVPQIR